MNYKPFSMGHNGGVLILAARGRSTLYMSTPFDSFTPIFYMWSVGIFSLLPFKSYIIFFMWLEFPIGVQKLGFSWQILDIYRDLVVMPPQKALPYTRPRLFLSHCASNSVNRFGL